MDARFFRNVQDAPWYAAFLQPARDALAPLADGAVALDVGTGAGKLIELEPRLAWTGIDTDAGMLTEARQRPALHATPLLHVVAGSPWPVDDASMDAVTFCSVLFLLADPQPLIEDAWRTLRPGGRVVVLTPSGKQAGRWGAALRHGSLPANWTFHLWRRMTAARGRDWSTRTHLADFARAQRAGYAHSTGFDGLATVEVLVKP